MSPLLELNDDRLTCSDWSDTKEHDAFEGVHDIRDYAKKRHVAARVGGRARAAVQTAQIAHLTKELNDLKILFAEREQRDRLAAQTPALDRAHAALLEDEKSYAPRAFGADEIRAMFADD